MICPYCAYDNIPGNDSCEQCLMDLRSLDEPAGESPIEDSLIHEPVRCLDPKPTISVAPDTSVADVIEVLVEKNIGCVLVENDDGVQGIFSERDVLLKVSQALDEVRDKPVSEFMTPNPEQLDEATPLAFALNRMSGGDFRHLPLTRGGRLSGIVSLRDFLGFVFRWYPGMSSET
jgi:CBS domain-containing protein